MLRKDSLELFVQADQSNPTPSPSPSAEFKLAVNSSDSEVGASNAGAARCSISEVNFDQKTQAAAHLVYDEKSKKHVVEIKMSTYAASKLDKKESPYTRRKFQSVNQQWSFSCPDYDELAQRFNRYREYIEVLRSRSNEALVKYQSAYARLKNTAAERAQLRTENAALKKKVAVLEAQLTASKDKSHLQESKTEASVSNEANKEKLKLFGKRSSAPADLTRAFSQRMVPSR